MVSNLVILKQMIRLSRIIKDMKEARYKLSSILSQSSYFIVEGDQSDIINNQTKDSIANCLYTEKYLRLSVSNACKCLNGFNASIMEPVDYISSSDVKNKFVDICKGKKIVATICLSTGKITMLEPEQNEKKIAEEKSSVENS